MDEFRGWPRDAADLVRHAADAHGGFDRFRRVESFSLVALDLSGPLPRMKGIHILPARIEVFPHERKTIFHGYPQLDQFGVFEHGQVSLYSQAAPNEPMMRSERHRDTFRGLRKNRRWSELDTLYFFGYALLDYMSFPFVLKDLPFVESCQYQKNGRTYRGVTVEFPANSDTHGKYQSLYFGEDGRIVRHDYKAEVVGFWANGAHFWNDYQSVEGFSFPTRRNVVGRLGGWATSMPVLTAILAEFSVKLRAG
jgi:hypothetical protein